MFGVSALGLRNAPTSHATFAPTAGESFSPCAARGSEIIRAANRCCRRRHLKTFQMLTRDYKGLVGMNRLVGLGVVANNIVNIGRTMRKRAAPRAIRAW
jgi:hypothetical protein